MPAERTFARTVTWSPARRFVTAAAAVTASVVWTQALAAALRRFAPADAPEAVVATSVAAALVALTGVAARRRGCRR